MPTKSRGIVSGSFYHAYNRAADKMTIFYTANDYEYFINKILYFKKKTNVKILAYCILPNHWHFLLKEPTREVATTSRVGSSAVSTFISLLSNSYTRYFNTNKEHSGRIFQGPFRSKLVSDDNYLRVLINYINLNHLKHKITKKPNDWFYTSHHNYVGEVKNNLVDRDYLIDFTEYKRSVNSYIRAINKIDEEF
jgi:REP element-mobilizing transposase RayT